MSATTHATEFTQDWSNTRSYWPAMMADYGYPGQTNLRFLEIGCYEGRTTVWLLDHVLTDPSSTIDVVDTFEGSPEFADLGVAAGFRDRFARNVASYGNRVRVHVGRSQQVLLSLEGPYDFVYVDGSHDPDDVLLDGLLAWPLLLPGAVLVFDDYGWGHEGQPVPRRGIDEFLRRTPDAVVRLREYQCVVEKKGSP